MKRVALGLSGGVDSAVAAILLKEQGYEVVGITFKFTKDFDASDAIRVAAALNIEHHVIDYEKIFKEKVIDKFLADYKKGITPNPCIMCNKEVKLNFLYQEMHNKNCVKIATGHYAKIIDGNLYRSTNKEKDQTYFLCEVNKEIINKLLLPLEGLEKETVRRIAALNNLSVATKKDSTDICFITKTFKDFINKELEPSKGKIIEVNTNKILGTHNGLSNYTIGQRRGLNIGGTKDRIFVVGKDTKENILYVTIGNEENLNSNSCLIEKVNLFNNEKPITVEAVFRYHAQPVTAKLEWLNDNEVILNYDSVRAVTPGQACAFYHGDECLGGGIIKSVRKDDNLWNQ